MEAHLSISILSFGMKIEHSELYNDFLSFYFETSVDGKSYMKPF